MGSVGRKQKKERKSASRRGGRRWSDRGECVMVGRVVEFFFETLLRSSTGGLSLEPPGTPRSPLWLPFKHGDVLGSPYMRMVPKTAHRLEWFQDGDPGTYEHMNKCSCVHPCLTGDDYRLHKCDTLTPLAPSLT